MGVMGELTESRPAGQGVCRLKAPMVTIQFSKYTGDFVRRRGIGRLGIHTTEDNLAARGLHILMKALPDVP